MSNIAVMPYADYEAACNSVRAKTGKTSPIKSGELATEIDGISVGGGDSDSKFASLVDGTITEITAQDLAGATRIADYAFYYRRTIKSATIPGNITSMGNYAFYYCTVLESVEIHDGVTTIGQNAFRGCSKLVSVTLPNDLLTINQYAFADCSNLTSIEIPDSVMSIGNYAFSNCGSLTSIVIPDSVTSIGNSAFSSCSSLINIVIPDGVTSISTYTFNGCSGMQVLDFSKYTSVPTLSNKNAFNGVPSTCKVIIPDELYDSWIAATNWSALTVTYVKKSEYVEEAEA